jgi:methyl-accepting chemotaxis protein
MKMCQVDTSRCVEYSHYNKTALQNISKLLEHVSQMISQTTSAMMQQLQVAAENSHSLISVSNASKQAEKGVNSSFNSVASLNSQAADLNELARTFSS